MLALFLCDDQQKLFVQFLFEVGHIICGTLKFRSLDNRIVFVCIRVSTSSNFNVFQNKSHCKVVFGGAFDLADHKIQLLDEERVVDE